MSTLLAMLQRPPSPTKNILFAPNCSSASNNMTTFLRIKEEFNNYGDILTSSSLNPLNPTTIVVRGEDSDGFHTPSPMSSPVSPAHTDSSAGEIYYHNLAFVPDNKFYYQETNNNNNYCYDVDSKIANYHMVLDKSQTDSICPKTNESTFGDLMATTNTTTSCNTVKMFTDLDSGHHHCNDENLEFGVQSPFLEDDRLSDDMSLCTEENQVQKVGKSKAKKSPKGKKKSDKCDGQNSEGKEKGKKRTRRVSIVLLFFFCIWIVNFL